MSDKTLATPRPLPPAKARRLPSLQFPRFPPPPYAPSLDQVVLDAANPVSTQADPTAVGGLPLPFPSSEAEEWFNEKSREELSELLLKADELIKSRESELSLTSALCKSLYHDNVTLKGKHESLVARLPVSPAPSAPSTPYLSSPNVLSPPYNPTDLSHTSQYDGSPFPRQRFRHTRRISVTTADLAGLADQNAELLDKLERLEAESNQADHAGKRKLRKLEREIQGLREELELTRAKEAELEERASAVLSSSVIEAQKRKEEREERVKQFRGDLKSSSLDTLDDGIRDFAPPPELPRSNTLRLPVSTPAKPHVVSRSPVSHRQSGSVDSVQDVHDEAETMNSSRGRLSSTLSHSETESAIVSQLLNKIYELEQTNAQINQEQKLTAERLRLARWDAEGIQRLYEYLNPSDDIELEIVDEDGPEDSPSKGKRVASGGTIKFSSLRRSIHHDLSGLLDPPEQDDFANGISTDMQSTAHHGVSLTKPRTGGHKARKSVVGLFDQALDNLSEAAGTPVQWPSLRKLSPDASPEPRDMSTWSTAATDGMVLPSSAFSSLLPTPVEGHGHHFGRTLGSELGSEFGDDWGASAPNHHLRSTSLYEIAGMDLSRDASISPSASERPIFDFPSLDDNNAPAAGPSRRTEREPDLEPSTPPRGLQLTIEPATPTPSKPAGPASTRMYRLSQTVRSRTHRWVEGRFPPSSPPSSSDRQRRRPNTSAVRKRSGLDSSLTAGDIFGHDSADHGFHFGRKALPSFSFPAPGEDPGMDSDGENAEANTSAIQVRADTSGILGTYGTRREGFAGFVIEVWLWLQFAIVIVVFLWAMAKRGPKSVLEEAERRRARGAGAVGHR